MAHSPLPIELINSTDVSKGEIMNNTDTLPLVFPSIVSLPKKNIWHFK